MGKHVVAYLTWRDFLKEVETLRPETIRVQTYHQAEGKRPPLVVRFWAEASFVSPQGEVHVVRLPLGSVVDFQLRNNPDVQSRFASVMEEAERILREALAPYAARIRPGLYAATHGVKIETSAEGLWRWRKDGDAYHLVPELQEAAG